MDVLHLDIIRQDEVHNNVWYEVLVLCLILTDRRRAVVTNIPRSDRSQCVRLWITSSTSSLILQWLVLIIGIAVQGFALCS